MNNLSWALYIADLFHSIGGLCAIVCVISAIAIVAGGIGIVHSHETRYPDEDDLARAATCKRVMKTAVIFLIVAAIIGAIIPSLDTTRMILVSEFGERLYNTKDAQEIIDPAKELLKQYIQDQLRRDKK